GFKSDLEGQEYGVVYDQLRTQFVNVEDYKRSIESRVQEHNHSTHAEVARLKVMTTAIQSFERRINDQLAAIQISDLTKVSIGITTVDGFRTLHQELTKHGQTSNTLMKDSFYQRLNSFCTEYADKKTGHIGLDKVVKGVNFKYHYGDRVDTKPQSNGTIGMVNAVLLTVLIKNLVPNDVRFSLPIIYDEIGSLDVS